MNKRIRAFLLAAMMVVSILPVMSFATATEVATADALGTALATGGEIKLTADVTRSFDVSNGQNIVLDLNGKTLTLAPPVGSSGTKSQGIRVLFGGELTIKNGTVVPGDEDILFTIANYGTLTLENVELKAADYTQIGINNRGNLTLAGNTEVETGKTSYKLAITNDPYNYTGNTDVPAVLNIASADVKVGAVLVELDPVSGNISGVELNISAGVVECIVVD